MEGKRAGIRNGKVMVGDVFFSDERKMGTVFRVMGLWNGLA